MRISVLLCCLPLGISVAVADPSRPPDLSIAGSVVKIIARSSAGKQSLGSGVIIAPNKVVTNCHVTRAAESAFLLKQGFRYNIEQQAALPQYDVCILASEPLPHPPVPLADQEAISVGDSISIYGYPFALGIRMRHGAIVALHDFEQSRIIEINAGFMQGASGGGVFNQQGELLGLMTFMGRSRDNYHFYAIPAVWIRAGLLQKFLPLQSFDALSFWEKGEFGHLNGNHNADRE